MAQAARRHVDQTGVASRIHIREQPLSMAESPSWDAAVCLFVAHFVPDDGARADFWEALASRLRPGKPLWLAEISRPTPTNRDVWCRWASDRGVPSERVDGLRARLDGGFATLSPTRSRALANAAGFRHVDSLVRLVGVTCDVWHTRL